MTSLSVVIPTHGRPEALARLLHSIVPVDVPGDGPQVVVVDDGSAPDTYEGVKAAYPSVKWLRQPRSGPATARNTGWQASTGDTVVFVDDDCVLAPDTLSLLQDALARYDAAGASIEPLHRGHLVADYMHAEHLVTHKLADGHVRWLVTACVAVRRPALESVGGFDEHLVHGGEDVDLSLRLKAAGFRLGVVEEAVAYHDHRASLPLLVRTYYRHGTGQRRLAAHHPERRADLAQSTRSRLSPAAWAATYRDYRRHEDRLTSAAFVGLRVAMMVPWLIGAWRGPQRAS
ncbi:MAG TPA: glycosyltransferase [Acidimicrobiales bacterium]|nr:glycosyltransferase [Acidimicrobiales bacterium]